MHREVPTTTEVKKWVKELLQIRINFCNWSWLLYLKRPSVPRNVPVAKEEEASASTVKAPVEEDVEVSVVLLSG